MKDPTATHVPVDGNDPDWQDECAEDGKTWPCKTIRKWRSTNKYRLKLLEEQVERLGVSNAGLREEGDRLRDAYRELDLVVNGGLVMAISDAMRGTSASMTISREVVPGYADFSGRAPIRVARSSEFNVEYRGIDGSVWKNKQLIERNTPTWP